MGITKTLLTEILLGVTNEEILGVARETHRKATRGLLPLPLFIHLSLSSAHIDSVWRESKMHISI